MPRTHALLFFFLLVCSYTDMTPHAANLVLQSTVERIFVPPAAPTSTSTISASSLHKGHAASPSLQQPGLYADIPRGVFLVRGENVLLLGEIDLDKDDDPPPGYERVEPDVIHRLNKERRAREAKREKVRLGKLREMGFEGENEGERIF
jgi:U6 snRNA-associated Sm-like protein LSm1